MDEKMPERILAWSWSKGVREHLDLPEIQACIDDGKGNTLGTVYLRATPVLEHAAELLRACTGLIGILTPKQYSKQFPNIYQHARNLLATIKREEWEAQNDSE